MRKRSLLILLFAGCNPVEPTYSLLVPTDAGPAPARTDSGPRRPPPPPPPPPPPVDAGAPEGRLDGHPCDTDSQCLGGRCMRGADFPGGYCTATCRNHSECDRLDGECVEGFGPRMCARGCYQGQFCREGYFCQTGPAGARVCLPMIELGDGADGSPCQRDGDCFGGLCLRGEVWPGGYCTTRCFDAIDCHPGRNGAECGDLSRFEVGEQGCLAECETVSDCRAGYVCARADFDVSVCVPDIAVPPALDPPESYPYPVECGGTPLGNGRRSFGYEVAPGTVSYMIAPFTRDGRYLYPVTVRLPSGNVIDFDQGTAQYQAVTPFFRPWINPTQIPLVSEQAEQLEVGVHTFTVETESDQLCWYLLEEATRGTTIDIAFYFVGTALTSQTAGTNPDWQEMESEIDVLLAQLGLTVGEVTYRDITGPDAQRYSFLPEMKDFGDLMKLSVRPPGDRDAQLVVNVFFVQMISFGPLGISSGLPGAAGLHGTEASGVVTTTEFIGVNEPGPTGEMIVGNRFTAQTVVHEIGHYIGLFHTTELRPDHRTFDPVTDTPECPDDVDFFDCPDIGNVMFPFADPRNQTLTTGQGFSMKTNPLTKD